MCCECGTIKVKMGLDEREYVCEKCGVITPRDLNAALNLRDYGVVFLNKLGTASTEVKPVEIPALAAPKGEVKLRSMKQESQSEHLCSLRK